MAFCPSGVWLKSLFALFAFEAAGRHMSFTAAGRELGVTHAVVSKPISVLEPEIGAPLFARHRRQICLTTKGVELFKVANASLFVVALLLRSLRKRNIDKVVIVGATITIAKNRIFTLNHDHKTTFVGYVGWNSMFLAIIARAMRAIFFSSASATSLKDFFASRVRAQSANGDWVSPFFIP